MTLRLTPHDTEVLREAAAAEGRSMQEIAITAIKDYLAKRDEFRVRQVKRFLTEDAELLELLSQ